MKNILDATKRFELQTQQEISNYNRARNSMLQEIRNIKSKIEEVDAMHIENYAALMNDLNEKISLVEKHSDRVASTVLEVQRNIRDQIEFNAIMDANLRGVQSEVVRQFKRLNTCETDLGNTNSTLISWRDELKDIENRVSQALDRFEVTMRCEIKAAKNEILDRPSEVQEAKRDLEVLIAANGIDVCGIMRELTIYKKQNMITEKKIENLYTLIDRLQSKKGE
jgi:seryl-tRNA synthetase